MDIILQFYGLSFFLIGLLALIWAKQESNFTFTHSLWLLGIFGLTRGLTVWTEQWRMIHPTGGLLDISTAIAALVSYLCLLEFGRRLLRAALVTASSPTRENYLLAPWIYLPILAMLLYVGTASEHPLRDIHILSRYCAGLPGALLTGAGFFIYWRRHIQPNEAATAGKQISISFRALAACFVLYAFLDGLFVPALIQFSSSGLDDEPFLAIPHPAQIAASICAILMAVSMIFILKIFNTESRKTLLKYRAGSEHDKEALTRASRHSELLLRTANEGIHILDINGNIVEANDAFCRMLQYSREAVLGMNVAQWDANFSAAELKERLPDFMDKRAVFETKHRRRDGTIIDVEISTVGVNIENETLLYCSSRDITDRKYAEAQLRLIARAFDRAAEGVIITDEQQKILTVNEAFTKVTGYTREEVIGKTPAILQSDKQSPDFYKRMWADLNKNDWWQGEIWNRNKSGKLYLEWLSINVIRDDAGKVINYIGMFSDITLIKESRQRMEYLATHDELTDLPNRTLFNDHLRLALARSNRAENCLALMFVDLDNFKVINDTLGHEEGDALLKQVAIRLKKCVREEDTVARLGGDEFVILLEMETRKEVIAMAKRILDAFAASFTLKGLEYFITASIGISLFPDDTDDPKILMRHADTAMYHAKERGKNTYVFFTADMSDRINHRMQIELLLRQAIQNDELFLEYQPQIELSSNRIVGVEALVRWRHEGEVKPPAAFIPIAEESGLIIDIEEWVIGAVCRQIRTWDEAGVAPIWVSINISAHHFHRHDIYSRITGIVALASIPSERLCLELTEGFLMDVENASSILYKLHEGGFRVSVDDFGTGFSSLSYLKRLPIHEVKIDRSFVDGIASESDDHAIATAIIAMAHSLGLQTVAEGVETESQHKVLKSLGCDIGQGFLYARPMQGDTLRDWILDSERRSASA